MSKARLVITAVVLEGRSQTEVAKAYGVSKGWVSKLVARYRAEGDSAFEPRSRRPRTSPNATDPAIVELIIAIRRMLNTSVSTPERRPSAGISNTTITSASTRQPSTGS